MLSIVKIYWADVSSVLSIKPCEGEVQQSSFALTKGLRLKCHLDNSSRCLTYPHQLSVDTVHCCSLTKSQAVIYLDEELDFHKAPQSEWPVLPRTVQLWGLGNNHGVWPWPSLSVEPTADGDAPKTKNIENNAHTWLSIKLHVVIFVFSKIVPHPSKLGHFNKDNIGVLFSTSVHVMSNLKIWIQ